MLSLSDVVLSIDVFWKLDVDMFHATVSKIAILGMESYTSFIVTLKGRNFLQSVFVACITSTIRFRKGRL